MWSSRWFALSLKSPLNPTPEGFFSFSTAKLQWTREDIQELWIEHGNAFLASGALWIGKEFNLDLVHSSLISQSRERRLRGWRNPTWCTTAAQELGVWIRSHPQPVKSGRFSSVLIPLHFYHSFNSVHDLYSLTDLNVCVTGVKDLHRFHNQIIHEL